MRKLTAGVLALALAVGLIGCGSNNGAGELLGDVGGDLTGEVVSTTNNDTTTLYINLSSEPEYLDPVLNTTADGVCLAVNAFSGLYTYNEEGEITTAIAADMPEISEDGCIYTIPMKKTKWSNGDELTAADFIYSWNRAINPATGNSYIGLFDSLERNEDGTLAVTAPDDYTLEVHLKSPCAYFLSLLAFPVYFPVHKASVEAANPTGTTPGAWAWEAGFVCNGAYTLKEWKHEDYMLYVKNPNFYDASNVTMENLNFMLNTDDAASYTAYNSGDLDFADRIPSVEMESLLTNSEFHVVDRLGTYYLTFNVNAPLFDGMTPENAKKFRQAISMLIDRTYIVETIAQAGQVEADSFIPAGMSDGNGGFFKTTETSYYDATKTGIGMAEDAMALLTECGYTFTENGDGTYACEPAIEIPFISNEGDLNAKVASSIQSDLAQIGITMTVELQEKNAFYENRRAGNYVLARGAWTADYNDPINMLQMFATESGNNSAQLGLGDSAEELGWGKYDGLISAITLETDMEKRVALMHEAEDMLMDTYAVIPLYYSNDVYLQKSNVTGIYASETAQKYFMYAVKH